jgi:hypothetical protein
MTAGAVLFIAVSLSFFQSDSIVTTGRSQIDEPTAAAAMSATDH